MGKKITGAAWAACNWADRELVEVYGRAEAKVRVHRFAKDFVKYCYEIFDEVDATPEEIGRDMYFTAQGHGCGFWDGDWDGRLTPDQIDFVTEWCQTKGPILC